jgi:hypothetical protein
MNTHVMIAVLTGVLAVAVPVRGGSEAPPAPGDGQQVIDRVLAVVGGQVITQSDAEAAQAFGLVDIGRAGDPVRAAVDGLINRELILDEVNRYSAAEQDPAVVETRLASVRARFPSNEAFAAACTRTGITLESLRYLIRDNLRIEQYLKERFSGVVQPTEEELQRYYADHPAEFGRTGASFDTAREAIREQLILARRQEVITDWLTRLHRRTEVRDLYTPAVKKQDQGRTS